MQEDVSDYKSEHRQIEQIPAELNRNDSQKN